MLSVVLLCFAAVVTIVLGGVVYFQQNKQSLNAHFALLSVAIAGWIVSNALFAVAGSDEERFSIGLVSYGCAAFLALNFFLFCLDVAIKKPAKLVRVGAGIIGLTSMFLSMVPGLVAYKVDGLSLVTNTAGLLLYGLVLIMFFGGGLGVLVRSIAVTDSQLRKRQITVVLTGLSIAAAIGIVCNLIFPLFNNYSFVQYGPLGSVVLVAACAYSIIRYQLFDIKLAAIRSSAYILALVTLGLIYYGLAYGVSVILLSQERAASAVVSPMSIVLALTLVFLFQPVKWFFDQATDKIFYRDRYDSEAFYGRLSEILTAESTDLRKFLARIAKEIGTTLRAEVAFLQVQWGHHHASAGDKNRDTLSDADIEDLKLYVLESQCEIIVADALPEDDTVRQLLAGHAVVIAVPLVQKNTIFGFLFLGNRRSGEYTARDKKVLETISNELVIAVQNALSLQEIKDFNVHLKQRIEAATSELVASNEQLKRLDAAKDEFVSMASHQLRTPLTSVKGYISMVLEGDAGKITPMQKQLLEEAFISSERMVHLIGDFLNVSRLQTGKFVLDKSLVNLADLVEEEVTGLKATAKARSLTLEYRKPLNIPSLFIDGGKIHQVIMNFIDNAMYYSTEDTTITVKVGLEGGYVVFTVKDTGIGVPKDEQAQLFTKFFRATNARRQRPDGTGIGLYLAKKVIDAHGGTMVFESKEGKGSTFGFRVPIKKLSENPAETVNKA